MKGERKGRGERGKERKGKAGEGWWWRRGNRRRVQSRVPRVMNHAFSSPRNELERSAVARPVRQINNVICSPGSLDPFAAGPKDFARMVCVCVCTYGRTSVAVPHFPQTLFPLSPSQPSSSSSLLRFPLATFIF